MKKMMLFSLLFSMVTFFSSCECGDDDVNLCTADPQEDCVCTQEYDPVCGCDGETYSNACEAECNGIFEYTPGACK